MEWLHGGFGGERFRARVVFAILVVALLTVPLVAGVQASELAESEESASGVRLLAESVAIPFWTAPSGIVRGPTKTAWVSDDGETAYVATQYTAQGARELAAVSLDTGQEVSRTTLSPFGYLGLGGASGNADTGDPQFATVDPSTGSLVVAYSSPAQTLLNVPEPVAGNSPAGAAGGQVCVSHQSTCFAGVHLLDPVSLESVAKIPYRGVRADAVTVGTALRAMSVTEHGKLLALVEEAPHEVAGVQGGQEPRGLYNTTLTYVVQFDLERRSQDWTVRVDGCRGAREPRNEGYDLYASRPHAGAVFSVESAGQASVVAACFSGTSSTATVVKIPLDRAGVPGVLPLTPPQSPASAQEAPVEEPPADDAPESGEEDLAQVAFFGPDKTAEVLADPMSGRVLMRVVDGGADVWWVFDSRGMRLLGTIGIGPSNVMSTMSALDPVTGRLYTLAAPVRDGTGGLFVMDIRRTPIPQALAFPEFAPLALNGTHLPLYVRPARDGRPAWVMIPDHPLTQSVRRWRVLEDGMPIAADVPLDEEYRGRTLDLDESEGVTDVALDGAARGYGARLLMVGGVDAATRLGPVDVPGNVWQFGDHTGVNHQGLGIWEMAGKPRSPCSEGNRELVLGFIGPEGSAVVDGAGSRGTAEPVVVDTATRADGEAPVSRCGAVTDDVSDWDQVWAKALFGRPPAGEPRVPWVFGDDAANCVSTSDSPSSTVGDPVTGLYSAAVHCAEEEASGYAYTRGVTIEGLTVGESLSSFRIYRDPGRGIVSRVESVARGVQVPGLFRIDTVRGVAESWANGRRFTQPELGEGDVYDPNCDRDRTAGTCFRRHIFGVWTPGYQCGPCGDEETFADRMSKGMGANGAVRLRQPEPNLARGADNGFIAAITKPDRERFADLVLNNDLLQTVLPTLEIIRYAPPNRVSTGGGPRGRQIIQLAGVEVSSSYGIQCLLVYDEESNTCGAPVEVPGSIVVSLQDADGKPLAGGGFEVRADVDADGVLGLVDTLVADGACVTAEDGVGTCRFENLQPGAYLVSQVAAPPGYAKSDEPWVSEVASGEQRTVVFTNVSNVSTIELSAEDADGNALSGAVFAAYPDPDADGKVAPDAEPAATCTTDESGSCTMSVPAGSYVLVQTAAPGGLEGIEPVPFTFASGGQVAAVTVRNYPPETAVDAPPPAAGPIDYSPPVDVAPPVESVGGYTPPATTVEPAPEVSVPERIGGTVVQVIRAPGDALRLLSRDPKQAAAWMAALALFCLAVLAVRRRQQAMALIG